MGIFIYRGDHMKSFKYKDLCPLLNCEKEIEVQVDESKPEGEQYVDFYCDYAAEHGYGASKKKIIVLFMKVPFTKSK